MPIPRNKQKEFFREKGELFLNPVENQTLITIFDQDENILINDFSLDSTFSPINISPLYQQPENSYKRNKYKKIFYFVGISFVMYKIFGSLRI